MLVTDRRLRETKQVNAKTRRSDIFTLYSNENGTSRVKGASSCLRESAKIRENVLISLFTSKASWKVLVNLRIPLPLSHGLRFMTY